MKTGYHLTGEAHHRGGHSLALILFFQPISWTTVPKNAVCSRDQIDRTDATAMDAVKNSSGVQTLGSDLLPRGVGGERVFSLRV